MNKNTKTRSGKKYGLQLQSQSQYKKCSYCKKPGHNILYCKDSSIDELYKKASDASVFGDCLVDGTNKFLRVWLDTLTNVELKVLGYRFYFIKKLKLKDDHERENYIIQLAIEIGFQEASWPLPQKLIEIPDKTFSEFIEILLANSHEIWHEYFETLISIHRPHARRFNIKPCFIQKKKKEKNKGKNKGTY